jgi:hypothetical protein
MIVINNSNQEAKLDLRRLEQMVPASFSAKEIITDQTIKVENTMTILPTTVMILEIK